MVVTLYTRHARTRLPSGRTGAYLAVYACAHHYDRHNHNDCANDESVCAHILVEPNLNFIPHKHKGTLHSSAEWRKIALRLAMRHRRAQTVPLSTRALADGGGLRLRARDDRGPRPLRPPPCPRAGRTTALTTTIPTTTTTTTTSTTAPLTQCPPPRQQTAVSNCEYNRDGDRTRTA